MKHPHHRRPAFLSSLNTYIEEHLSDADFDVGKLLRLVGMSRTDLHRKLEQSVGMSTTAYVRNKRLEKAAELLKQESDWSVMQVAHQVGFENHSYFSKRFKELFGRRPLEWRERAHYL